MSNDSGGRVRPVILAGGAGTRLWPMSTPQKPKHLLPLIGDGSLFEQTLARFGDPSLFRPPIIVANQAQGAELSGILAAIEGATLVLEPMKRDSAPAIALAAWIAEPDDVLLMTPSDHHIADLDAFHAAIAAGLPAAEAGDIVTFGIEPDHPATGFGYIRATPGEGVRRVDKFIEKPATDVAQAMFDAGSHYWNAGIFLARASTWRRVLEAYVPDIAAAARDALGSADRTAGVIRPDREAFARSPAQSIDYAVMEKETAISVVPVTMGWSDIGSWQSLFDAAERDDDDNSVGHGHVAMGSAGNLIRSSGPRIAAIGVEGLVIVATADAVLVVRRDQSQRVREAAAWYDEETKCDPS